MRIYSNPNNNWILVVTDHGATAFRTVRHSNKLQAVKESLQIIQKGGTDAYTRDASYEQFLTELKLPIDEPGTKDAPTPRRSKLTT